MLGLLFSKYIYINIKDSKKKIDVFRFSDYSGFCFGKFHCVTRCNRSNKVCHTSVYFRLVKIKEWVDTNDPGALVILMSCAVELKMFEMEPEEQETYLKENKIAR